MTAHTAASPAPALLIAGLLLLASPGARAEDAWQSGVEAFKSGDLESAEQVFRGVVEDRPDWHGGHLMLGQTLLRQSRYEAATRRLSQAVVLDPETVSTRLKLAQAAARAKRYDLVISALEPVDLDRLGVHLREMAHRLVGHAAFRQGDYGSAAEAIDRAIGLAPKDASLHLLAAQTSLKLDHFDAARRSLEKAHALEQYQTAGEAQDIARVSESLEVERHSAEVAARLERELERRTACQRRLGAPSGKGESEPDC
ncbi:MAG: tetratricopeptide repeat protein [Acidobacteriota bacterium]